MNKIRSELFDANRLILVVNDDGVRSPGIAAAAEAAAAFGEVMITAPVSQQTSMGRAYPRYPDLGVIERIPVRVGEREISAYGIHSSPAHAAAYGIIEIADRKPDLVVSGINLGANLARSITCSGTLGACFEAASEGVSSLAVSLETPAETIMKNDFSEDDTEFSSARRVTAFWIERILRQGMPRGAEILNVNVPYRRIGPEEFRMTRLDSQNYYVLKKPPERDWSRPFTMDFEIRFEEAELIPEGDIRAVCVDRVTSVTPLGWDLTKE